ncbi:Ubx4p KNAG_0M02520 [Huiozyma naganishii CBS 8797]|uniref:UBX domain-containing protein n=1 Tax=Huiozyma naganishii (strain ATCC MYA-139 / BCRC 22969 / CBS 8797 / KCTC 17520 / NBRC 10181 / NCYC 3082 / Yp74L-3) TaxID=1071383 RepID=J7RE34_HUIN7|nr:hypothetical protein KNAG_0M02520 [Kazachstania naganishii CBS 8797]CCK73105.1 hypothetical protein KNAG_0M02520 [Kazachstania naganishii CBS 8797]
MGAVTVQHEFRAYTVELDANSVLKQALEQSVAHFRPGRSADEFSFMHGGKTVPLDTPWRLMNLPQGANLQLVEDRVRASVATSKSMKVRFQVAGLGSVVREVVTTDLVANVLAEVKVEQNWSQVDLESITIRVLSIIIKYADLIGKTFQDLGINSSTSITINLPTTATVPVPTKTVPESTSTTDTESRSSKTTAVRESTPLHKPIVYISSDNAASTISDQSTDEDAYELTVEQAQRYQRMLSKQAGGLGGPLLTKRLREQQDQQKRRPTIKECLIRVKFPDRTFMEMAFQPSETSSDIYNHVKKNLKDESMSFNLYEPNPYKLLIAYDDKELVRDFNYGSKTVLLFEPEDKHNKGPYLKGALVDQAKTLTDMVKSAFEPTPTSHKQAEEKPVKVKKTLDKVPKWLKLSKK